MHCFKQLIMVSLYVSVCLLTACGSDISTSPDPAPISLQAQYSSAVTDTRIALPSEISRYLTPSPTTTPILSGRTAWWGRGCWW